MNRGGISRRNIDRSNRHLQFACPCANVPSPARNRSTRPPSFEPCPPIPIVPAPCFAFSPLSPRSARSVGSSTPWQCLPCREDFEQSGEKRERERIFVMIVTGGEGGKFSLFLSRKERRRRKKERKGNEEWGNEEEREVQEPDLCSRPRSP